MKTNYRRIWLLIFSMVPFLNFAQGTWTQKAPYGGGAVSEARAFAIGNYGYIGGPNAELWRYNPVADSWTQMANMIGPARLSPVAFSIAGKGYLGTGGSFNDFYEYDTTTNAWTQLTNFGGTGREGAVGIAINGKGYVGLGGGYLNDWWEFDPATNAWTQKANLSGPGRYHAGAFSLNGLGYVCCGFNGSFMNDLLAYDPVNNSWTTKTPMPGTPRDRPVGLATNSKGYLFTGWSGGIALSDAWEYDPVNDQWTQLIPMPTAGRYNSCGFTIADKAYIGTGDMGGGSSDFWLYGPDCSVTLLSTTTTCALACDGTATITSPDSAAVDSMLWSNGQTTMTATGLCVGTYTVTVTDTTGCSSISMVTVPGAPPIPITSQPVMPLCFGDTNGSICVLVPGPLTYTYLWSTGDTAQCIGPVPASTYTVTVTDSSGCQGSAVFSLTQPAQLLANILGTDATCQTCANGSAVIQISGGSGPMMYQWSNGFSLAFINNILPGLYTCCVTDVNGCSTCDSVIIGYLSGIGDSQAIPQKVVPNPFHDAFRIPWSPGSEKVESLILVDMAGREIPVQWECQDETLHVTVRSIPEGNYVIRVSTTSGVKIFRAGHNE